MKVTNEPPAGLRAGMLHNYSAFVDQEKLERVDTPQWRTLLFGLCFLSYFFTQIKNERGKVRN